MLTTVEQVQSRASKRGISTTGWIPNDIIDLIEEAQAYIEEETSRIFDNQELSAKFFDYTGKDVNLPEYPILAISEIKIDDKVLEDGEYGVDEEDGVIHLKKRVTHSDIEIQYTGCYEPPHPVARGVCIDLVLASIKFDMTDFSMVQSLREGDKQVTYLSNSEEGTGNWLNFNSRLSSLKRNASAGMI